MLFENERLNVYNNQDFLKIREECSKEPKSMWEDPSYKATYDEQSNWDWKRPGEITSKPRFMKSDGQKMPLRFDRSNLSLGGSTEECNTKQNLAVLSALTLNPWLFRTVVPDGQEFTDEKYAGVFRFRFWRYGKWYEVCVDDRLPTKGGKLVSFLQVDQPEEFWFFLLDKAYTKLCGSTESFSKTRTQDLLADLTGGISETLKSTGDGKPLPVNPGKVLFKAIEKQSPTIFCPSAESANALGDSFKDVYCITKAVYLDNAKSEKVLLLRIFNTFKTEVAEYKGPWSEQSDEWKSFPEDKKTTLGLVKERDGEFWMPLSEFKKIISSTIMVHLNPKHVKNWGEGAPKPSCWFASSADGKWVKGVSSGGDFDSCLDTTFQLNPQYIVSLSGADDGSSNCTIIVDLLQKTQKRDRVPMRLYVFELDSSRNHRLDNDFFKHNKPSIDGYKYRDTREVANRFEILPGKYCIVAATYDSSHQAPFLLRVFTEKAHTLTVLDEKVDYKEKDLRLTVGPSTSNDAHTQEFDKKVNSFFDALSGECNAVGWSKLKQVLNYAMENEKPTSDNYSVRNSLISYVFPSSSVFDTMEKKSFSNDLTRSLLAMADIDQSGKLSLQEFQTLWLEIRQWIKVYEMHSDDDGFLPKEKLREALDSAGFQLNNDILANLAIRYSNREGRVPFDDFLMVSSKLKTVFDYFKSKDPENTKQATFSYEEWLQKTIYS